MESKIEEEELQNKEYDIIKEGMKEYCLYGNFNYSNNTA